ncbi:MAG TPA: ABC transporter permease [Gemmatimonadales bacterium]|nr:ABC transporter permease [Gemmatimonadales bacterium]
MRAWLARRVTQAVATLAAVLVLLFFLMRAAPGDPLDRLAVDRPVTPEETAALRARYGLDQPVGRQFVAYARGALRGDFGTSIEYGRPVAALIAERMPPTLLLGGVVLLVNFTLGIWLGVAQAVRRGGPLDRVLGAASLAGHAMPSFWLGLALAWLVAVRWRLLPPAGMQDPLLDPAAGLAARAADLLAHLALPALTLCVVTLAGTMRYQRRAMLEVLRLPYIVTARAKGLPERIVRRRHAWRNALFPVLALFGLWLPFLVTGAVFVESVFAWPGLGSLAAEAVGARDYPLLMGTASLAAGLVVLGGLLTDLAYAALDPRVREAG